MFSEEISTKIGKVHASLTSSHLENHPVTAAMRQQFVYGRISEQKQQSVSVLFVPQ